MVRLLKAVSLVAVGMLLGAGVVVAMQVASWKVQHEGRCGAQQWPNQILWFDVGMSDYEEFGIAERWARAHRAPCYSIWVDGPLQAGTSGYWPPLHYAIAAGGSWEDLEPRIDAADDATLKQKDVLGRTLLHWGVTYGRDELERTALKQKLIDRGLSLDDRDADGLTPRDWEADYLRSGGCPGVTQACRLQNPGALR